MSMQITSWLRAFFALQQHAIDSRGFQQVVNADDDVVRWPRTLGIDVIVIASVLDPTVREQSMRHADHGIARRWHAMMEDLERDALIDPLTEYAENQEFWHTLPAICVYLHSHNAPLLRPEVWDALLEQLGEQHARNVGPKGDGPFKHFDGVKTFDDLYIKELLYLKELRGYDTKLTDDGKPPERIIPRSTNADVIALTDYWTKQLGSVKEVMGHKGVVANWKAATADVDQLARKADPNAGYSKNNAFWRALRTTAIHVATADEAKSKFDIAVEALKDSVTHLPENVKAASSTVVHAIGDAAKHGISGLVSELGTPVLIGGAAIVALILLTRGGHRHKEA